jgi:hypothetical protein
VVQNVIKSENENENENETGASRRQSFTVSCC